MAGQEGITAKKSENFSEWYNQVVQRAELADYAPVEGCMVFRPNGYAIWENIQKVLDGLIKEKGVRNVYFPQLIPESLLKKESEHFAGFVPECAWVTIGGKKELGERLAIRPTSETIMYSLFSKWIRSWRDLPLKINQWCNVTRWEAATKFFVRTTEFLWQEGHTAHATKGEAEKVVIEMLKLYRDFLENFLAIPTLIGKKSELEKFKGAVYTTTLEGLMPDGRIIQLGTSHLLGRNFSRVFDIKFLNRRGEKEFVWQTSWGISSRIIGAMVMMHGDDRGAILPPRIAYAQVVIVPIFYKKGELKRVLAKARKVKRELEDGGIAVILDDREGYTPGWKFNEWELKGIPLRIEIGPRDVAEGQIVAVRRDNFRRVEIKDRFLLKGVGKILNGIQKNLLRRANRILRENIRSAKSLEEFKGLLKEKGGFIRACWCGSSECEQRIKELTGATIRLIPFEREKIFAGCIFCSKKAADVAYFGRAY